MEPLLPPDDLGVQPGSSPTTAAPQPLLLNTAPAPAAMPIEYGEQDLRAIDDTAGLRKSVYGAVLDAARSIKPIANNQHTLVLSDVDYSDDEPEPDRAAETKALLARDTVARKLRGTWQLINNADGAVLAKKRQTIANVPHVFPDGTVVMRGTRYAVGLQQRLRPGLYIRNRKNGESETHANIRAGKGPSHRYILEPESGRFFFNIGHSRIPLVALLDTLGAKREEVEAAWGKELTDLNYGKSDAKALSKLYDRLVPKRLKSPDDAATPDGMKQKIRDAFADMEVDPEVTGRTIGMANDRLNAPMILAATKRTLDLARRQTEQDDRDHPAFATYHDMASLMAERVQNDYGRIRQQMLYKLARKGNLNNLPAGWLDKQVHAAIFSSGLASAVEETNPLEVLDKLTKVTRYGEGGLPGTQSTPMEARNVGVGQVGFIDLVKTSESLKAGVDVNAARQARIGPDKKIYSPFRDLKTGKTVYRNPGQILDSTLVVGASPVPGRVMAVRKGKLAFIKEGEGDYQIPNYEETFSPAAGFVPLKSAMFAQRLAMGSRMSTQAMPIEGAEAPFVSAAVPGTNEQESYEDRAGKWMGAIRADKAGKVLKITPDYIEVVYEGGKNEKISVDNYRPTARKSYIHNTPMVQPGDVFQPGQLLAKSNFTDDNGTAALGRNVRTAFMHYGDNWEDAVTLSQSAAKKMKVLQAYKHAIEPGEGDEIGTRGFLSVFANKYKKDQVDKLDSNGVITPGVEVNPGDPLILAIRQRNGLNSRVHRQGKVDYADASVKWDHHNPGVVTHVYRGPKGVQVVVKSAKELEDGDKISGRFGNKGTIRVLPDNEMPVASDGKIIDALISPLSVISRGNSSFPLEMALGKIAEKTGKRYKIEDFGTRKLDKFVKEELAKHNISDTEKVFYPAQNRYIDNVLVGNTYLMALHHLSENKGSARGLGSYSASGEPARGPAGQSKRLSMQDLYANMAQGAYNFNKEASLIRGKKQDDFWAAFMNGYDVEPPKVNDTYDGLMQRLQSIGINPVRRGKKTQLLAMKDDDVQQLAGGREVTVPDTVNVHKDLAPVPGGLFDPKTFGDGTKFGLITLPEAIPNPVFEDPIKRLLGLTEKQFRGILSGEEEIAGHGRGPSALASVLKKFDVKKELERARAEIAGTRKTARDAAVRRLGYLKSFEATGTSPTDLLVTKVPVIPPRFRPINRLGDKGNVVINDANFLYRELMLARDNLKDMQQFVDHPGQERLAVYDAYKALIGLTDPKQHELKSRGVQGILKSIVGSSPKQGLVQRRLLSTQVDTVGRSVLVPDSQLTMNQVGLPVNLAMNTFQPYIIHDLAKRGMPKVMAMQAVKDHAPAAVDALKRVMSDRPVVVSRAPVLHKYGIFGLDAQLIPGNAMRLNPLVYKGLAADNDGDTLNFHIPHSRKVVKEVRERMMPSSMLIMPQDRRTPAYMPTQDHMLGLYEASTKRREGQTRYFTDIAAARRAFERGELDIDEPIAIVPAKS